MEQTDLSTLLENGEGYFAEGDLDRARSCFREVIEADSDHIEALNNLGVIAFQYGDYNQASVYFNRALEIDDRYLEAIENMAQCQAARGEFLKAVKLLQKAFELGAFNNELLNTMAQCFIQLGDIQSAKQVLKESLKIDSRQKDVKILLKHIEQPATRSTLGHSKSKTDKQLNIGFVSIWFERGQSYVTKLLRDAVSKEHNTFIFARTGEVYGQPKLETRGFWDVPNLTVYPEYQISPDVITQWIQENNLDAVVFNEEYDWGLVQAVKRTGIKAITYLDYYKKDWEPLMGMYDAILCSSRRTFDLIKDFCNAYYIGWAVDSNLFRPQDKQDETFTFFHNAGWLGINYRKMTPAVVLAFDAISRYLPETTLFIHSQVELAKFPPLVEHMIRENPNIHYHMETVAAPGLYHKGRILVFPTKLEGLGLPLFEALACGLPVIATDSPPMNEFITDGYNGLLVRVAHHAVREDNIAFPETIIDVNDLARKMALLAKHPARIEALAQNALNYAKKELSIDHLSDRFFSCTNDLFSVESGSKPAGMSRLNKNKAQQEHEKKMIITTHFSPDAEMVVREVCKNRSDIVGIMVQRPNSNHDPQYEDRKTRLQNDLINLGLNINWFETTNINDQKSEKILKVWNPSILITVGGRILKENIINIPKKGVVNLHTSILPKYRNLGSEFWAQYYNDLKHIGHTIHFVDTGIDTGPMILQKTIDAKSLDSQQDLRKRNMHHGASSLLEALDLYDSNSIASIKQPAKGGLFFRMPTNIDHLRFNFRQAFRQKMNKSMNNGDHQSLIVGLAELTYAWKQMFEQEGLSYEVCQFDKTLTPQSYAAVVINRILTASECESVLNFIKDGGAVLTQLSTAAQMLPEIQIKKHFIKKLSYNSLNSPFMKEDISLQLEGFINGQAEWGKCDADNPAILIKHVGKGMLICLPFDPENALLDDRTGRVLSESINGKRASERIALVNKGGVRRLVMDAIKRLYSQRGLPYVHLWYYPGNFESAFSFRIDSDGYEQMSFNKTFEPAYQHGIRMSWFIDVGAQKNSMGHALEIAKAGQDVQVHCFQHETFEDYDKNYTNISIAVKKMQETGLSPIGFVAPFGKWNTSLNRALEKIGIQYSSEFSLSYDDLPFYPVVYEKRTSKVLQVPVHPFCLGNMLKSDFTLEEVDRYFEQEMKRRYIQGEPMFFYGHPIGRLGSHPQVLHHIFAKVKKLERVWMTDLTAFYLWWKEREKNLILPHIVGTDLVVHAFSTNQNVVTRVIMPDGSKRIKTIRGTWRCKYNTIEANQIKAYA